MLQGRLGSLCVMLFTCIENICRGQNTSGIIWEALTARTLGRTGLLGVRRILAALCPGAHKKGGRYSSPCVAGGVQPPLPGAPPRGEPNTAGGVQKKRKDQRIPADPSLQVRLSNPRLPSLGQEPALTILLATDPPVFLLGFRKKVVRPEACGTSRRVKRRALRQLGAIATGSGHGNLFYLSFGNLR